MPHADTAQSFGAAVRHLFRHLDDVASLRRNPLARKIIGLSDDRASASDAVISAKIRSSLLDGGRACYAEDVAAGRTEKANRQFAILSALCSLQSAKDIALELNLSLPQLYRDRRAICERATRALLDRDRLTNGKAHVTDELRFGLWRAAALAENGFSGRAIAECERIVAQSSSPAAKALTLLRLGDAALRLGDVQRVREAIAAARRFVAQMPPSEMGELAMTSRLIEFRLDMHSGRHKKAAQSIEELTAAVEDHRGEPGDRCEIHAEILLDACRFAAYNGRTCDASSAVERAAKIVARNPNAPPSQRVEIAVLTATFALDKSVDSASRFVRLNEAMTLAYSVGSAMGVLFSSIGLAYQCLALRDEHESQHYSDQALHVASSMEGRQSLLFAIASLAPAYLHLKRWEILDPCIYDIESAAVPMTDLWTNLKLSQGAMLARSGRHEEALAPLHCAVDGARALQRSRSQGIALREYALSSYASGRVDDARACIRSAIGFAEGGSDLLELRRTYRAASRILRDSRMSRLAMETGA
jgi:tetratricopeptide (TPR) repeat protein